MKLATIISALRAYCPSFEGRVGGAAEYAAIDITNLPMPCAFVLPVSEIGEDMDSMGTDYRQRVKQVFCVVILVSTADQERGQDAFDAIEDLKAEIFKAILGTSTAETDEIVYEGYSDPDLNRARLALQLSFSVSYDVVDADTGHGRELDGLPDLKGIDSKIDPAPADWVDAVSFKVTKKRGLKWQFRFQIFPAGSESRFFMLRLIIPRRISGQTT